MNIRADVAELLHAGYGDRTIARRVGVTIPSVTAARTELGLPKARRGNKRAASIEDLFWRRVKPVDGGHLEWDGYRSNGTPAISWGGSQHSAYRIAFTIRHGAEPIGVAHATCEFKGCVAPDHMADSRVVPRRGYHRGAGRKPNGSREDIIRLLRAGGSNQGIAKQLRTDAKRVREIRAELGIGPAPIPAGPTFAEKWAAVTEPTSDGHVRWTGRLRDGVMPSLVYRGRDYSARRAAFEELHGRNAIGMVLPGCDWAPCVKPEHLEDRPMRQQLANQFTAIFGDVA